MVDEKIVIILLLAWVVFGIVLAVIDSKREVNKMRIEKDATFGYFNNKFSLGFNIGCLCEDKTFYESLVKLLNDTEKRFQYKFDIL